MTTNKRRGASAVVVALIGVLALFAGPAGGQTDSGGALAVDGSVASGTAFAENDSTASGDSSAVDGSTASGCATAVDHSTASGAPPCPADDGDEVDKKDKDKPAPPAKASTPRRVRLTG